MPTVSKSPMVRPILLTTIAGITVMIVAIAARVPIVYSQATDEQQKKLEAALQKLTPAQQQMVRPLLQREAPSPGGEIHGFVAAEGLELREGALPGAQVFVEKATGTIEDQSATRTNSQGRFRLPFRAPGVYNVCATLKGFAKSCTLVAVVNQNVTLVEPIKLKPEGTAIRGCVTMKDGTPASRNAGGPHESVGAAEISAEKGGQVAAGPVPVNAAGCYVLPLANAQAGLELVVHYEEAMASLTVPSGAQELAKRALNVELQTSPPKIASFTASFDTPTFLFDQVNAPFSVASQSEKFRVLNIIATNASTDGGSFQANSITSQTVRDVVDGWYSWCGGVAHANCAIDELGPHLHPERGVLE